MILKNSPIDQIVRFLKQLGLDAESGHIYLYLLQHGPDTVLGISRGLKTGRTKLYPLLEELSGKQLITIHERHYGTSYEAQPPEVLEFLVSEKERHADALRSNLPAAIHVLDKLKQVSPTTSRVAEYRGIDGLKQMNWNLTKAKAEFRVFELAGLDKHLGNHFANKLRSIWTEKHTCSYDLTNNLDRTKESGVDSPTAQVRYIDPEIFKIEFETYTYNNVVAMLSYDREDIFGVEIYNDKLARQQKQLFDVLWHQSKPLKSSI